MIFHYKEATVPALKGKTVQFMPSPYSGGKHIKGGVIYPEKSLNFRSSAGRLCGGFGTRRAFNGNPWEGYEVKSAYIFGDAASNGQILFSAPSGVYAFPIPSPSENADVQPICVSAQTFSTPPQGIRYITAEGASVLLLCAEEGIFSYDGNNFSRIENAPPALTGCACNDRIFLVDYTVKYRLYFSAPLDAENWTAAYRTAGYLDLSPDQGAVCALIPCGKLLYALRERGLTLIRADAENFNFSATPVPAAFGKAYANSAQAVGSRLIFFSPDGLYVFNGDTVRRIAANLTDGMNPAQNPDCRSCVFGAYYALNYRTAQEERRTLFLDSATETGYFSDINFSVPFSDGSNCYFSESGVLSVFTAQSARGNAPLRKTWYSGYTHLHLGEKQKILRELTLTGKGNFMLTVEGEHARVKRVFSLCLDGEKTVFPQLRSRGFYLLIESKDEDCALETLGAKAEFLEEIRK